MLEMNSNSPDRMLRSTAHLATWSGLYRRFMMGAICLAVGLALVFPPKSWEGPSLLHLGRGHGFTISDLVALLPLMVGAKLILQVLWRLRTQMYQRLAGLWAVGGTELFLAGVAAGILVDGAVSNLDWKGSAMILWGVVAVALAVIAVTRRVQV